MLGLCMRNGKPALTPVLQQKVVRLRCSFPMVIAVGAVLIMFVAAVSFARAQPSFSRDSQLISRRNIDSLARVDVLDRLRDNVADDEKDMAVLKTRVRDVDARLKQIEALDLGVVKMRLTNVEESNKDDRIERLSLRTTMLTTFGGLIVVLFSSWWSRRNGAKQ